MVRQKLNLVEHLILPQIFSVRQNVWCAFRLILTLVGHFPMSDRYFKTCGFEWSVLLILC